MAGIFKFQGRRPALRGLTLLAAAMMLAAISRPTPAVAASIPSTFLIDIAPSARVLDALDDLRDDVITQAMFNSIKYDEACDNPHLRVRARNKPAIMVSNNNATSDLTSFTLQIAAGLPYAFGNGDVTGDGFLNFIKETIYTDPGVSIASTSVDNPANPKALTVNFNGLSNDRKVIFNVDLDTTDPNIFVYPDYRMVLFGAPLEDGGAETTPANATVRFANGTNVGPLNLGQACDLNNELVDYSDPAYANANIRPYHVMDPIEVATLPGIPEPSAAALSVIGLLALVGRTRKGRPLV